MTTEQAILTAIDELLGLDQEDMQDNMDLNLFESGLVDSLAMVTLINEVESYIGSKIEIKKIKPENLLTVNKLIGAINNQILN